MRKTKASEILKEFGLTDDQILKIATANTLNESVSALKEYIHKKWDMDTLTAMQTVTKLKEELQ